jgi:hypothetical protein
MKKPEVTAHGTDASTLGVWAATHGQIVPSDSYTNTGDPTKNCCAKTVLDVVGRTQATYIQFNLASFPARYAADVDGSHAVYSF